MANDEQQQILEALDAGPGAQLFERVMASENIEAPQLGNAESAIKKAVQSGDPNLENWAASMRRALESSGEAEAIERAMAKEAVSDPLGLRDMADSLKNIVEAVKEFFSGDVKGGLSKLFSAFSSAADPKAQELASHRAATEEAMAEGKAYLEAAEHDGTDVEQALGGDGQQQVATAIEKIDSIVKLPAPSGPGSGPG